MTIHRIEDYYSYRKDLVNLLKKAKIWITSFESNKLKRHNSFRIVEYLFDCTGIFVPIFTIFTSSDSVTTSHTYFLLRISSAS